MVRFYKENEKSHVILHLIILYLQLSIAIHLRTQRYHL